jgi:hypothetical protein
MINVGRDEAGLYTRHQVKPVDRVADCLALWKDQFERQDRGSKVRYRHLNEGKLVRIRRRSDRDQELWLPGCSRFRNNLSSHFTDAKRG